MTLVLRDVKSSKTLDSVSLEDGQLGYATGVAQGIIEGKRFGRQADATDSQMYAGMTGWTNGYLELVNESEARAAGADTTPGHDQLHHYWTKGAGLAKWAGSPKPWTTLVALLTPHVGLEKAKVYASRWFIEVFGYAAGSDKNRVAHGHPPRGEKVGPG